MGISKPRINRYDNLKGLAIILVVFGHFEFGKVLDPYGSAIFLIDLPLFFFVAGYFSKIDSEQPIKSFKRLIVPYFIFCLLIELFRLAYTGSMNWNMIFIQSSMAMWFLISLFIMKMILPILDRLRYPIITTLLFALLFGLYDLHPNILALSRTFAYLPIFLLGFYFNRYRDHLKAQYPRILNFYNKNFKILFILLILVTAVAVFKISGRIYIFKSPYKGNLLFEAAKRLIMLVIMMIWMIVLNRIMTNRSCILTKIGRNSMAVYVLHPFIFYFFKPIWPVMITNGMMSITLTVALTAVSVFVLSRDIVTKYLNMFTDGVFNLIVRPS